MPQQWPEEVVQIFVIANLKEDITIISFAF